MAAGGGGVPSWGSHASRALTHTCTAGDVLDSEAGSSSERFRTRAWARMTSCGSPGALPATGLRRERKERGWLPLVKNPPLVSRRPVAAAEESTCLRDGRSSRDSTDRGSRHAPPLASQLPGHRRALPGSQGGHPCTSPAPPPPARGSSSRRRPSSRHPFCQESSCSVCTSRLLPRRQETARGARAAGQRTWSRAPSSPKPPSLSSRHSSLGAFGAFGARRELPDLTRIHPGGRRGGSWCSRSCPSQAGVAVSRPAWPRSVLATGMPRGRCDVGARAEPQHRGAMWKHPALMSKHVLRKEGNHCPSLPLNISSY